MNFSTTIKDVFKTKPLRKRILYTLFFAIIYRLGTFVLIPWYDSKKIIDIISNSKEDNFWDRMLATSFHSFSVFSLGIGPYITASILTQLASFAFPYFQRLEKERQSGRRKLDTITRWLTIPIAIGQGITQVYSKTPEIIIGSTSRIPIWFYLNAVLLMVAGAIFSIWLADQITSRGLTNGSSVLIMVNTLSRLPQGIASEINESEHGTFFLIIEFIILFAIILLVILFMQAVRKIPLQYARQNMIGGFAYSSSAAANQYLPIKINATGVMPIIFANILVSIILFLAQQLETKAGLSSAGYVVTALKQPFGWKRNLFQGIIIFIATIMYMTVFINPMKIANELKRSNAFISGVRPGKDTGLFIDNITTRVIIPGGLFLVIISIIPALVANPPIGVHEKFTRVQNIGYDHAILKCLNDFTFPLLIPSAYGFWIRNSVSCQAPVHFTRIIGHRLERMDVAKTSVSCAIGNRKRLAGSGIVSRCFETFPVDSKFFRTVTDLFRSHLHPICQYIPNTLSIGDHPDQLNKSVRITPAQIQTGDIFFFQNAVFTTLHGKCNQRSCRNSVDTVHIAQISGMDGCLDVFIQYKCCKGRQ